MSKIATMKPSYTPVVAFALHTGEIRIDTAIPETTMPIIAGPEHFIRSIINTTAHVRNENGNAVHVIPGSEPDLSVAEQVDVFINYTHRLMLRYRTNTTLKFGADIDAPWSDAGDSPA